LKDLVAVIPNAVRIVRGHATIDKLALEAFDVGADRILVIRNWKGNPKFLDVYEVLSPSHHPRICTLVLKGFKLARECGNEIPQKRPSCIALRMDLATSSSIPEELVECLVRGVHAEVANDIPPRCVEIVITPREGFYEVSFRMSARYIGPVLRVWRAKTYLTRQG